MFYEKRAVREQFRDFPVRRLWSTVPTVVRSFQHSQPVELSLLVIHTDCLSGFVDCPCSIYAGPSQQMVILAHHTFDRVSKEGHAGRSFQRNF